MVTIDWLAFGEDVLLARRRAGLSQRGLAAHVGISRNYASMIERGVADPGYVIVVSLCRYLKISLPEVDEANNRAS